jgi:hypothetical protein
MPADLAKVPQAKRRRVWPGGSGDNPAGGQQDAKRGHRDNEADFMRADDADGII